MSSSASDINEKHIADDFVIYVNGKKFTDSHVEPETTLLNYIRKKLRLTGSKLSCGEGGCGACTVMLSKYDHVDKKISHYAINACYTPVCSVHGMAITTVEGIGSSTKLHPVQERLVKAFGLQCGFCSPGMVMSMYTLLRNNPEPTELQIEDCLGGNLCRCTGYRPILEGFKTFAKNGCCGNPSICNDSQDDKNVLNHLFAPSDCTPYDPSQELIFPPELQTTDEFHTKKVLFVGESVDWIRPTSLEELLRLKTEFPAAKLVVGNAEVGFEPRQNNVKTTLISATHVPELNQIDITDSGITFGSSVTMSRMYDVLKKTSDELPKIRTAIFTSLMNMLELIGDQQLRNVAGIGSHIMSASPLSDINPMLMAAEATLIIVSHKDGTRTIPLDSRFFTAFRNTCLRADDVLVSVTIPCSQKGEYFRGYKVKNQVHRRDKDVAMISAGMKVLFEDKSDVIKGINLSFGGTGPTVIMATDITERIQGRKWDDHLLRDVQHMLLERLKLATEGGFLEYRKNLLQSFFFQFYLHVQNGLSQELANTVAALSSSYKSALTPLEMLPYSSTQMFQDVPSGQSVDDPVGRPIMNESSLQLATGEAIFLDDITLEEGELHFALVTSKRAHAKIISIDASDATSLVGVRCFVGASDVPGRSAWSVANPDLLDEVIFASDEVLCVGQVIGGIVADTPQLARKAATLVKVEYEELEHILTVDEAIDKESFMHPIRCLEDGDVNGEFKKSDFVVEGEVRVGGQYHYYMETQCCIAQPKERGEMIVTVSSQSLTSLQVNVAAALGIPVNKVTCKIRRVGGGFGGKDTSTVNFAMACAVAAKKVGKTVRLVIGRDLDMQTVGLRHPLVGRYKVGFNKDGKLRALESEIFFNAGYSYDLSMLILEVGMHQLHNAYMIPAYKLTGKLCRTNLQSNTSMRGIGTLQSMAFIETVMDTVATKCGVSPVKVREINLYKVGDTDHFYQDMPDVMNLKRCWDECLVKSDFHKRRQETDQFNRENRWKKRGLAIVPIKRMTGIPIPFMNQGAALVHIYLDGSVLLTHGGIEIGQGLHTKTIQIASRVLRISSERIHISETSTDKVPNAVLTAGSSATDLFGSAVKVACETLMDRLEPFMKENPKGSWEQWVGAAYFNRVSLSTTGFYKYPGEIGFNWEDHRASRLAYNFMYGAACCDVEIDCLTGDHQMRRVDIVMDVGKSLNPALDIGQIEGAFMQGYGLFVVEELRYSQKGELLTRGPGMYKIPCVSDIPRQFNVHLLKGATNPNGIYSAKAIGEPPCLLGVSALVAIRDAISSARSDVGLHGNFKLDCPSTPERIRHACSDDFPKPAKQVIDDYFVRP
ncbi:xanthine dehydrogenase/oxidase-like [Saccoglossus kowalevskii]|uniref:Xanthine dehydrogenase/oxidase-like n=1 Tax=Saccoglossus kowalevskii TaxID=10224 RepID=A0ABM0LXI3_SACKO|nr:PREDICTED: xanthine dehydrogenase/oxidase-like [Saccoglossus kowalevskii]